jgi:hemerythrin superfamily protein
MSDPDKELMKLERYCKHWADHNISHKESFLKWKNIAKEKGLESIEENLNNAMKAIDNCNEYLITAYNELRTLRN